MASKKSNFSKNKDKKKQIIKAYGAHDNDSGSPMVQIALLTQRIEYLISHLKEHKKDQHSRKGLLNLVGERRKMVSYLKATNDNEEEVTVFLKKMGLAN